ncbi:PREDICTED: putative glucosylceramidase 4 [Nicrophorus vespilloides]|uniref:Glucosylceramidase n=1 Tax=Nicrophorus vespilloides TaxID=110193 RepID=A0ABM1MCE2_NICVS|nr:PREDICTED: putative glucosylceramidase 4 [Nicrophorus vespilloides]
MYSLTLALIAWWIVFANGQSCDQRKYDQDSVVCVCNATYCDSFDPITPEASGKYLIFTSDRDGRRFQKSVQNFSNPSNGSDSSWINRNVTYQGIVGFGGAFTDSTGININSLDEKTKSNLISAYFSKKGIEYNMGRVPIGGTDFSTHAYSYMDNQTVAYSNVSSTNFTLAPEDLQYKIPLIKNAQQVLGRKLKLFGSAWIAPRAWKSNGQYSGFGFLNREHFQDWADYHIRFLQLYKEQGLDFWGITTGNEPNNYLVPFNKVPTVAFFFYDQQTWINNNFGPTLRNSSYSNVKLIGLDDNRIVLGFLDDQLKSNVTRSFIDGIGIHWYTDFIPASVVTKFHNKYPNLFIFGSEACIQNMLQEPVVLGSWGRGEQYANDIINDLQNWMGGWVDWNMALNVQGGPTYINNFVDSPIIVNATAGEFYKQPTYYALGHFSKFLPENSVRVKIEDLENLQVVAFQRPDNATAVIVLNSNDDAREFKYFDNERGEISFNCTPHSISSILYW